ncbi:MAG: VTT domain-containing protein [Myxococcota bacterium]
MGRYVGIFAGMAMFFLALFGAVEAFDISVLRDPNQAMSGGGVLAALVGVGLLVADVLIPVPASVIMIAHGVLFGAVLGAALSLVGSVAAAAVGFGIGRRGGRWLDRLVTEQQRARADALLQRWGMVAIIATRPVPIVAESVAILAGTSSFGWTKMLVASAVGSIPAAVAFALVGAWGVSFDDSLLIFGAVLGLAGLAWVWGRRFESGADEA